jgi:hypothetical protein
MFKRKLISLLFILAFSSLACLQTAVLAESVSTGGAPTAKDLGWVLSIPSVSLPYVTNGEEAQLLDGVNSNWRQVRRGEMIGCPRSKYLSTVECE